MDTNNLCVSKYDMGNKLPHWFTSISCFEVWKKETVLPVGVPIASGSKGSNMSFRRDIKVPFFPRTRITDM